MLELCGEHGYRSVTLELVLSRCGATAEEFSANFADLEACFAAAYETEAEGLCTAMLTAARDTGDWRAGTEAALTTVLTFAADHPQTAKALVREVHVVAGATLAKHEELLDRLARAIEECQAPPAAISVPRAPSFIVGAVEAIIAGHLDRGEARALLTTGPELMDLIATFLKTDSL